ncbi:MAG TPA: hypothetical protein VD838_18680 [Anaeromyxobacteraceae bacterium]|nr:hypothetical protein [Anaeromyxobacteraceae bacterium]
MEDTPQAVHYFDPLLHRTPCGAGFEQRSTKHVRRVTCAACIAHLAHDAAAAEPAAGSLGA